MLAMGPFGYPGDYLLWWVLFLSLLLHTWCFFRCFPKERFRKFGLVLGNGLVFLCMLGVVAMIAETHLRFVAVETDAFGLSLPARRWFAIHTRLNSLGCRDEEWPVEKPPGTYRIAFVGDSFTYGWGVKREEDRLTELVRDRLNQSRAREEADIGGDKGTEGRRDQGKGSRDPGIEESRKPDPYPDRQEGGLSERRAPASGSAPDFDNFQLFNVAKPGWGTGDQIGPIRTMIDRYDVDEIVLCYVPNDIEKLIPVSGDFNPVRPPMPEFFNPESSCLLDHLYWRFYVPRLPSVANYFDWLAEGFANDDVWRVHQQQLGEMIRLCKHSGVRFRAVLMPFLRTRSEKYDPERLHATLRAFFESNDVPVLDLLPITTGLDPAELVVNPSDPHPNERAQALFAEAIMQAFYAQR